MKKFILMMIGLLCLGIGSVFAESKTNEDIIKINSTYTIKKGSLRTLNEGSVSIKTLEDTQGFEWKDVLKNIILGNIK